jgi:beta-galactosidase
MATMIQQSRRDVLKAMGVAWMGPIGRGHKFEFAGEEFRLDGKPFVMVSGELHPARIPVEYWQHRIRMAKAMGCNTIACYVFWNYHEPHEGQFDFSTENRDIARFVGLCAQEGLWVLLRPGPYVCAEWEFGGLPPYLLRTPDLKVRCMDPRYMAAAEHYLRALARIVKPLMWDAGGPVLMVQVENEYGSFGNDRTYMKRLREIWRSAGINGPFYTADGATTYMLEAGSLEGAAVGLDPGARAENFALAKRMRPGVPVFSAETYPGWLTHWGEKWARPSTEKLLAEVGFLLENKLSFNLYVVHGGTNFGFTAGANSGGEGYEPDITSYDYDAPIDEQGRPTAKYHALRELLGKYGAGSLPALPDPVPAMSLPPIPMRAHASLWANLGKAVDSVQPKPMEAYGQDYGVIVYETELIGRKNGKLTLTNLHDYATVFVDGKYAGKIDRREGEDSLELPKVDSATPKLTILVEAMGRINFAQFMIDRKGITDRATLNGMTLMNWKVYSLPLGAAWVAVLKQSPAGGRPGVFFKGEFDVAKPADTFLDLSGYAKGIVWVNGRNLGRYWQIGPQKRLYCPGVWLKAGRNEITVFDLHRTEAAAVAGYPALT